MRPRLVSLLLVLLVALAWMAPARTVLAQPASLRLPFPAGTAWRVIQGYQGGTHGFGPERYALDLVRDGEGATAGAEVLAPASGTLWFMHAPGAGNGCLSIRIDGGAGLIVQMCHILARGFRADERIEIGQVIGTIGPSGTVGNNGVAHMHISLHRTPDYGSTRVPAPFAAPDGLPIDGIALPPDGTFNQYACPGPSCRASLVSSNGRAPRPAPPPAAPVAPVVAAGTDSRPAVAPAARPGMELRAGVIARVATDGGCLNVREGPGAAARAFVCLPNGFLSVVAQGPIPADGRVWWLLENWGWVAGDYLTAVVVAPPALRPGTAVTVDAGEGDCLNLREAPSVSAPVVVCLLSGARLTITDGPREADGRTWWQVDGRGWAAGEFLRARE